MKLVLEGAEWPGLTIVLRESRDSADLIHAVETGDIDLTFIDIGPCETGPLQVRSSSTTRWCSWPPRVLPRRVGCR